MCSNGTMKKTAMTDVRRLQHSVSRRDPIIFLLPDKSGTPGTSLSATLTFILCCTRRSQFCKTDKLPSTQKKHQLYSAHLKNRLLLYILSKASPQLSWTKAFRNQFFALPLLQTDSLITALIPNLNKILLDFLCHIIYLSWESKKSVKKRSISGKGLPTVPPLVLSAFITS